MTRRVPSRWIPRTAGGGGLLLEWMVERRSRVQAQSTFFWSTRGFCVEDGVLVSSGGFGYMYVGSSENL